MSTAAREVVAHRTVLHGISGGLEAILSGGSLLRSSGPVCAGSHIVVPVQVNISDSFARVSCRFILLRRGRLRSRLLVYDIAYLTDSLSTSARRPVLIHPIVWWLRWRLILRLLLSQKTVYLAEHFMGNADGFEMPLSEHII